VVTAHLVDEQGHPTMQARDEILQFFTSKLLASIDGSSSRTESL